jgi:hypothetical protein
MQVCLMGGTQLLLLWLNVHASSCCGPCTGAFNKTNLVPCSLTLLAGPMSSGGMAITPQIFLFVKDAGLDGHAKVTDFIAMAQ